MYLQLFLKKQFVIKIIKLTKNKEIKASTTNPMNFSIKTTLAADKNKRTSNDPI